MQNKAHLICRLDSGYFWANNRIGRKRLFSKYGVVNFEKSSIKCK